MIKAITKNGSEVVIYPRTQAEFNAEYDRLLREGAKIRAARTP